MANSIVLAVLGDRPIAFHPALSRLTGSVTAGVFLSQLLYWWQRRTGDSVYKTREEWEEETTLTPRQQRKAEAILKRLGFLAVKARGVPPTNHYYLDEDALLRALESKCDKRSHSSVTKGHIQTLQNVTFECDKMSHSILTESTSENTTEKIHVRSRGCSGYTEEFERFWQARPRRPADSKPAAFRAWQAALRRGATAEQLLAAQEREKEYHRAAGTEPRFIPMRSTWLNQERWEAEYPVSNSADTEKLARAVRSAVEATGDANRWREFLETTKSL